MPWRLDKAFLRGDLDTGCKQGRRVVEARPKLRWWRRCRDGRELGNSRKHPRRRQSSRPREGQVICDIYDLPFAAPPFEVRRTKYATDQQTYLDVANVNCAIFPTADGQIARIEAALKDLADAPVETRSCPQVRPQPLTVKRLIGTAKKHGLRLYPDARCIEPGVVAQASARVPYDLAQVSNPAFYDQGDVTCLLRKSAVPSAEKIKTITLSFGKRFDYLNVSCKVEPNLGQEAVQIGRMRATFEDLAQTP